MRSVNRNTVVRAKMDQEYPWVSPIKHTCTSEELRFGTCKCWASCAGRLAAREVEPQRKAASTDGRLRTNPGSAKPTTSAVDPSVAATSGAVVRGAAHPCSAPGPVLDATTGRRRTEDQ